MKSIHRILQENKQVGRKALAVLIDPDKHTPGSIEETVCLAAEAKVDFIFFGGSFVQSEMASEFVSSIKQTVNCPVVIFPGNQMSICHQADGILYLSLISGRNAEFLIGRHVITAAAIKRSGLEVVPTGYMLVDSGSPTAVEYMSNTSPIPRHQSDVAAATAMAGEMLGLKTIYLEAGSGAKKTVPLEMISKVSKSISIPLIVGGGISNANEANDILHVGADLIVVGNAIEKTPNLIIDLMLAVNARNYAV
jgi:putative glycerol-1-phosphate prenyltransferase